MNSFRALDSGTRIIVLVLVGIVVYAVTLFFFQPVFVSSPAAAQGMMQNHMASMMSFANPQHSFLNGLSLLVAACIVFLAAYVTRPPAVFSAINTPADELSILKKALSSDEKMVLEEVERAGEITQDSLRFRLNWSKAKVSAILTNLDRMNIVQRQRSGKTYTVILSQKKQ